MAPQNTTEIILQEKKPSDLSDEDAKRISAGRILSRPPPNEEICITGMAGRFPESDDIYQYRYNLMEKVDMITCDNRRWEPTHPEIPQRTGKINYLNKCDAGFFGLHYNLAEMMDPLCRILLERTIEAIMDAGYHPEELRGTNTGVFIGVCFSESERTWFYEKLVSPNYGIIGNTRSMVAQRLSYVLGLKGPSVITDTACSSSLYAIHHAYKAIRAGHCEMAIVGGASLCLQPIVSLQFARLGVLSLDGSCKSFDNDANGYARSETISAIILQKTKDARRIYAQVVHGKANCDGYKEQGITFPSRVMQKQLLEEVYQESDIDPATLDFLEAHATGTRVGDPEEIIAIDEVFCVERKSPLHVGSIKSMLGHSEAASGMCSVVKLILAMENNCLLPNINYNRPKEGAEALEKGRMVVVTDVMPWPANGSGLTAINSFGFGGANIHVLLKRGDKQKAGCGLPRDNLPRLVCISGRTKEAISCICDDVSGRTLDVDFIRILQEAFKKNYEGHIYRGCILMSKDGELGRSIELFDGERKPACLVFGAPDGKWISIGKDLFTIPLFAATVQKVYNILLPHGVNITEIITRDVIKQDPLDVIVGNVAVQTALVDVLKGLNFSPDYVTGYSVGELVAAYADGALTLEQTILAAYYIAKSLQCLKANHDKSYQVQTNISNTALDVPNELEIIGINLEAGYIVSGPSEKSMSYISNLLNKGKVVKEIQHWFGLHSKQLQKIQLNLLQHLKEIILQPKQISPKWLTAQTSASPEYFVDRLLNPVLFHQAVSALPYKTVLVEIGQNLNCFNNRKTIPLIPTNYTEKNNIEAFLNGLARIYECGYDISIENLYPKIKWPVSAGTPMVSPLIKWNYSKDWFVALYTGKSYIKGGERTATFNVKDSDWNFMMGHVIDGRNLIPATGYLVIVWETYSMITGMILTDTKVVFENVKFHRATNISKSGPMKLTVMIQKTTGMFEVADLGQRIVSGRIYTPEDFAKEVIELPKPVGEPGSIILTKKDIYKELKLRGYNYTKEFRAIKESDLSATRGMIEWIGNWITFMDAMLQMKLLQEDTRNLYVPTGIERLTIDAKAHIRYVQEVGENAAIPAYVYREANIIKAGAIEIRGLMPNSIPRRKPLGEPVLEAHKFIPFEAELTLEESVRVFSQIFLENSYGIKVRVVEYIDESKTEVSPLSPFVHRAFSDQPLIQPEVVVLTKQALELNNIIVEDRKLHTESSSCSIVIVSNIFDQPELQGQSIKALKENGLVVSREDLTFTTFDAFVPELDIIGIYKTNEEALVLLRKHVQLETPMVIDMSDSTSNFGWLHTTQNAMNNNKKIILFAKNDVPNGILGFYNCVRLEPGGFNVRCVFVMDNEAPKFEIEDSFYIDQLQKGLAVNVFKDGKWGTYRHLQLPKEGTVEREHVYCNLTLKGDLSSLKWIEGSLTSKSILLSGHSMIQVYYASLNFRDVMTASGRISSDFITRDRFKQENVQGFEFVGRDESGKRVMGMVTSGALASIVDGDSYLISEVPETLTMEEAATIPVAYGTVLFACFSVGKMKPGESILIHAGSGAVGQAAINVALFYNCNVFTTVGTQTKRDFIRRNFPTIPESHIGNSRDTSFEQMVMTETNGLGVDMVLNSLSEEKLRASLRCLAPGGRFLEIGKADLISDSPLKFKNLGQNRSFHSIMLDAFFLENPKNKYNLCKLVLKGIEDGCVKPLNRTVFDQEEIEQAFRYMAAGKHVGKVVIKLRDEEPEKVIKPELKLFKGIPRFYGNSDKSYIIVGGLGGFGLELADWAVMRGTRKLILVSRTGIKGGYQASRIRLWKTYGVMVKVCTDDVTTKEGCKAVIEEANSLGPVEGIFNLAVVLKDALVENQSEENYRMSLGPKAVATKCFDELSRQLCPELKYFVVFSSVSCGRGNIGQSNYGMSNSIMERICESRKRDGLPALAIQWGAIGEVGLVAEMLELQTEIEIAGSLQQRVCSCLEVLDKFLVQQDAVVSSMVVAEKRSGTAGADNIIDAVKGIIGLTDLKTISLHSTFSELGMDSMMAVEIKQTLEREYEVFLTAQDIRSMTFSKLQDIAQEKILQSDSQTSKGKELMPAGIYLLLRTMGDEAMALVPMVRLQSLIKEKSVARKVFILPGIEGMATVMEPLAINLSSHCLCLQYMFKDKPESTVEDLARSLLPVVQENLPTGTPFTLVGYSYGAIIGIELAALLEQEGRVGRVILIDGAPAMFKELLKQQIPEAESEPLLQTIVQCALMQLVVSPEKVMGWKNDIYNCKTFEDRMELGLKLVADEKISHSEDYLKRVCRASYLRLRSVLYYQPKFRKLQSIVKLFKPSKPTIESFEEDYKLQQLCENPVEVCVFEGNHLTILKNPQAAYSINTIIDTTNPLFKQSGIKEKPKIEMAREVGVKQI